jgi:hypothetical protein
MIEQLAFDLSEPLPAWTGSPLRFHTDYLDPDDHVAAFERWIDEHDRLGCIARSGMWHPALCAASFTTADGHTFHLLNADVRRRGDERDANLDPSIPDALMYQAICRACRWHAIADGENAAVEAWHDHAFPGWRDLPAVPHGLGDKKRAAWIDANQPADWRRPGSPIVTERTPGGTRHVGGRSPFGGYDLARRIDQPAA